MFSLSRISILFIVLFQIQGFSAFAEENTILGSDPVVKTGPQQPEVGNAPTISETQEASETVLETVGHEDPLLEIDLLKFHRMETHGLSASVITQMNEATFQSLEKIEPRLKKQPNGNKDRVVAITPEIGQNLIESIDEHPIVSAYGQENYEQDGTEIGYCFGRATYVHLALLKLGVDKDSIRKIWLVGPMVTSGISWQFHVATVVRVTNGQWMVVDNFTGVLMNVRDWAKNFYPFNAKYQNLRVYVTEPGKFSVSLGKYSRVQLGLDLRPDQDWYRNYFVDLMKWFQDHKMSELGLPDDLRAPVVVEKP